MILSDVSIKRPVFATILNVLIVVFGLFSLPKLAIEHYPDIDFPVVSVWITWPGADPASVEKQILEPLERAVNSVSGLNSVRSTAYPSAGLLVLNFELEKNSDQVVQDIRDKVFGALGELPVDVETPIIQKFEIGGSPIINLTLSAKNMSIGELSLLAQDEIRPKMQRVEGVARVELIGDRNRELHILVNPLQLASIGATSADVVRSLKAQNLDMPVGRLKTQTKEFGIRFQKKITNKTDAENLPLMLLKNKQVRLGDVAVVEDTIANESTAAFIDQSPTVLISIFKQSRGNTSAIADAIIKNVEKINKESSDAKLTIVTDNSRYIKGSIQAVEFDLLIGAMLAILVVFIFLRDKRATIISAMALPTAVIGTFSFLLYMNFTLNMMSMLGLSLSIGILIDDAIVVIENIYRHLKMGKDPKIAAKDATSEIGLAVFATTLTVCAVFVPVAFMDGIIGRFFFQFGLTVAFAVLISLFVAFTLTPMLASKWLKADQDHQQNDGLGKIFYKIDEFYKKTLIWCLHRRWWTLGTGFLSFILSLFLLAFIPVSFFAQEDESTFSISLTLPENTNLETTKKETLEVVRLLNTYPGVENVVSAIAASGGGKINTARLTINLVKPNLRSYSQQDIINRVREDLNKIYENTGFELSVGAGRGGPVHNIQLVLTSDNFKELIFFSENLSKFIKKNIKEIVDITTSKAKDVKEYNVNVNLDLARDVGLNPLEMANGVRTLFEGEKVGQMEDDTGRFDIRVQIVPTDKSKLQNISNVTFKNDKEERLTLGLVSSTDEILAPASIERYDGQKQITVLANYTAKDLNNVISQIQEYVRKNAPPSISMNLEGEADTMAKSIQSMLLALFMAVLMIYLILCAQYERYLAPLVIMMALPLSLTGAFGALLLTGESISVYTMIGIILLMGLVTKNGILLIDFTLHEMAKGNSVYDSLIIAGTTRLRPILMTTFAAGLGMLPIALGHGEGGEAKSSMGIAVMGGLFMSTALTLVVVPCFFSLMEGFLLRIKKGKM